MDIFLNFNSKNRIYTLNKKRREKYPALIRMNCNILKTVFLSKRISKFDLSDLPEGCYILKLNTKIPFVKKFMLW